MGAYFLTAAMLGAAIGVWALAFGPSGSSDEASEPLLAWAPPVTLEPDPLPSPVVHPQEPDVRTTVSAPAARPEPPKQTAAAVEPSPAASPPAGPSVDPKPPESPPVGPSDPPVVSTHKPPTLPALGVPETSSPRVTPERVKPAVLPGLSAADLAHHDTRAGADASKPESVAKPRAPVPDRLTTPQPKTRLTVPRVSR